MDGDVSLDVAEHGAPGRRRGRFVYVQSRSITLQSNYTYAIPRKRTSESQHESSKSFFTVLLNGLLLLVQYDR